MCMCIASRYICVHLRKNVFSDLLMSQKKKKKKKKRKPNKTFFHTEIHNST